MIAFVNGMGGTPLIELYVMYAEVAACWRGRVTIARTLVGNYVTSLDMAGCSVTLLPSTTSCCACGTRPVNTPALRWGLLTW